MSLHTYFVLPLNPSKFGEMCFLKYMSFKLRKSSQSTRNHSQDKRLWNPLPCLTHADAEKKMLIVWLDAHFCHNSECNSHFHFQPYLLQMSKIQAWALFVLTHLLKKPISADKCLASAIYFCDFKYFFSLKSYRLKCWTIKTIGWCSW